MAVMPLLAVVVGTLLVSGSTAVFAAPVVLITALAVALAAALALRLSAVLVRPLTDLASALASGSRSTASDATRFAVGATDPAEIVDFKQALTQLLERVDREERARATITASITHDLRTPLIAAVRTLDAMPDDHVATRRLAYVLNARAAVSEALTLASMLVDLQRFGVRCESLRLESVQLDSITTDVVERARSEASRRGVLIESSGSGAALADPLAVRRAVSNLVENAVRHARSRVAVTIYPGLLRITDDGVGLAFDLESLAAPFAGKDAGGMAGLGLFIVRNIADLHGGRFVVEHTGQDGTSLLLYLPAPP